VVGEGFCDGQSPTFTVTLGEALHPLFGYVTCARGGGLVGLWWKFF